MALRLELQAFSYPGHPSLFAPCQLRLDPGQAVAVVGASGSGKSSLLSLLAGLHPAPLGGRLEGRVERPPEHRVGYLGAEPELFLTGFCETVLEEIGWTLLGWGWSHDRVQARVEETAEQLGISDLLWRSPDTLSGGQRQMVALAAVWAARPHYILLDEPVSRLDPTARARLREAVQGLVGQHQVGLLWATSQLDEVTWCPELWWIHGSQPFSIASCSADSWVPQDPGLVPTAASAWRALWGLPEASWRAPLAEVREVALRSLGEAHREEAFALEEVVYRPPAASEDLFRGLRATVARGECLGLLGRNGAGKSTLAHLLRGLLQPQSGRLRLLGRSPSAGWLVESAALVAYTFQRPSTLFVCSTVERELLYGGELLGWPQSQAERRARSALQAFGLEARADVHPRELSASEQSLLGLALSWFSEAPVQILDEPLARLDGRGRRILEERLQAWSALGTTVVLIAHDLDWLLRVCSRLLILREGRLWEPQGSWRPGLTLEAEGVAAAESVSKDSSN